MGENKNNRKSYPRAQSRFLSAKEIELYMVQSGFDADSEYDIFIP